MHAFHFRMSREKLRDFHRVFGMCAHSPRQCAHAAKDEPTIKRRGDRATFVLNAANPLKKIVFRFRNDDSAENIAMPAEIFCRGMQNYIGAEIEWPLQDRCPRVVAHKNYSGMAHDFSDAREVDNFQ